jgi:hypothetical protein
MTPTSKRNTIIGLCVFVVMGGVAVGVRGCGPPPQFTPEQQKSLDRLHSIAAYSGGDWDKVKPEDQQFLVTGPGSGNEGSARIVLGAIAAEQKQAKQ